MHTQAATMDSGTRQFGSQSEWLIACHDSHNCQNAFARGCDRLDAGDSSRAVASSQSIGISESRGARSALSPERRTRMIKSGYRFVGLIGIPLVVAVYLLPQLHALPNSSLSYSILYALISLLFNISSSALLRVF